MRDPETLSAEVQRFSVIPAGHPMGYQDAFNAFIADTYAAVRGEMPDGLPTFADGLRQVRITQAVLSSATTGDWVDVSDETAPADVEPVHRSSALLGTDQ
jgi:predicted dehydrogenase